MEPIGRSLTGTCAFRLLPADDLVTAPSAATLADLGAQGRSLTYAWRHPSDGEQHGALVIGAAGEDGQVEAAWFDTWHQQPGLMRLTGTGAPRQISLRGTYAEEWGWTVTIEADDTAVRMTMGNVIPESALAQAPEGSPPMSAGPYDVMIAEWADRTE